MAGIIVPGDRTTSQPGRGYCYNPECVEPGKDRFEFDVEQDGFSCPKCGSDDPGSVGLLTLIHLLVRDKAGPIQGSRSRYRLACDPTRVLLATPTNNEAASGDVKAVNCPGCLEAAVRENITGSQGWSLVRK